MAIPIYSKISLSTQLNPCYLYVQASNNPVCVYGSNIVKSWKWYLGECRGGGNGSGSGGDEW